MGMVDDGNTGEGNGRQRCLPYSGMGHTAEALEAGAPVSVVNRFESTPLLVAAPSVAHGGLRKSRSPKNVAFSSIERHMKSITGVLSCVCNDAPPDAGTLALS